MKLHIRIPPQTNWQEFAYSHVVTGPAQDPELEEFLGKGCNFVDTVGSRKP
jgi:hypothetical protein